MKKNYRCVIAMLLLTLLLSACQAPGSRLTNRQLIEDTLAGTTHLRDDCEVRATAIDDDWYDFYIANTKFSRVSPKYVYPENSWTPESVAQSYLDGTAPWLDATNPDSSNAYQSFRFDTVAILWSSDYNFEFKVSCDGWLYVNGQRSLPFGCITYEDLDPALMVERYQSGEWSGARAWSEDYRTSVELYFISDGETAIDWDGLYYQYYDTPAGTKDGFAYVYSEPATGPWWEATEHHYDVHAYNGTAFVSDVYPDLPGKKIEGNVDGELIGSYPTNRVNGATPILTTAGPYYFSKGELLDHWEIPVEPSSGAFLLDHIQYENQDHVYFFDGNRLLDLHRGRGYDVLLPEVCAVGAHECICWFFYLEDGVLKEVGTGSTEDIGQSDVIADRQVTAATGQYVVFLQFADDPNVYHLDHFYSDGTYKVTALGSGTVDEYEAAWQKWNGTFDDFARHCQAQNGLLPATDTPAI